MNTYLAQAAKAARDTLQRMERAGSIDPEAFNNAKALELIAQGLGQGLDDLDRKLTRIEQMIQRIQP